MVLVVGWDGPARSSVNHNTFHSNNGNFPRSPNRKPSILDRMSISFYITNFPHNVSYKDMWIRCAEWGTVVDVFIANRLSKAGKRFAFVRFIRVSNVESLRNNLNSMWFAKYKVFVDVVKFNRSFSSRNPVDNNNNPAQYKTNKAQQPQENIQQVNVTNNKTYAEAVSGSQKKSDSNTNPNSSDPINRRIVKVSSSKEVDPSDALSILLKVIEPSFIPSACQWLQDEGFSNVTTRYIGGRWIWVTFVSFEAKELFLANVSFKCRFEAYKPPTVSFVPDERMVWVEIYGIPKGAWHKQTFMDITEPWGKGIFFDCDWESACSVAKVCLLSQTKRFIFEELTIALDDKPFTAWIKEFAPWEPNILSPTYVTSDSETDTESCDDNEGNSNESDEDGENDDDFSKVSDEIDFQLCKEYSESPSSKYEADNSACEKKVSTDIGGNHNQVDDPECQSIEKIHQSASQEVESGKQDNQVNDEFEGGNDNSVADCKIPTVPELEVCPNKCGEDGACNGDASPILSDDVFSPDRIIRQQVADRKLSKSYTPPNQVIPENSSESSGAPGFIKGVYLNLEGSCGNEKPGSLKSRKDKLQKEGSICSSLDSTLSLDKTNVIMEVGKSMGFEVNDSPRDFAEIVNGLRGDKCFQ
ncbi:hypothetical protein OROGR_016856 [Orobanche gracilis]